MDSWGRDVMVGVLIMIPEPHATTLAGWRRRIGDPQADTIRPHVTLLPPTAAASPVAEIEAHLDGAARQGTPFAMHLLGTGTFRPVSPVVFVQVARGVGDCEVLEKAIRCGPLQRDLDFPYHPHVTVAQEVPDDALDEAYEGLADYVARFTVDRFTLYQGPPEGPWEPRTEFVLGQGRAS